MFSKPVGPESLRFFSHFSEEALRIYTPDGLSPSWQGGISTSQEFHSCQVKEVSPEHLSICLQLRDKPALDLTTDLMMNSLLTLSVINLS